MRFELREALALAESMVEQAGRGRAHAGATALALCALAQVQTQQEHLAQAMATATRAVAAARGSRDRGLLALALLRQATAGLQAEPPAAAAQAEAAAQLFEALGDAAHQGQALRVLGGVRIAQQDTAAHRALLQRAVALARASGDRGGEVRALNTLYSSDPDLAQRVRGLNHALRVAREAGHRYQERGVLHNLALTYNLLGLRRRALRLIEQVIAINRAHATTAALLNPLSIAISLLSTLNRQHDAERLAAQAEEALAAAAGQLQPFQIDGFRGVIRFRLARWLPPAARLAETRLGLTAYTKHPQLHWALPLTRAMVASAELVAGEPAAALASAASAVDELTRHQGRMGGGAESAAHVHWQHACALAACGRGDEAAAASERAYALLVQASAELSDEGLHRSVLHGPTSHAELVAGWVARARAARLPRKRWTAHLRGAARLAESVERMVATGLRLNEPESTTALHEVLIEEVAELLGARRALLVRAAGETLEPVGAQVPEGETAEALFAAVAPWLAEAAVTRAVRLRHGPEGADEIDQRSCLVAPLVAQGQLLALVYADLDGLYGRFHDSDRDLLATLAAQAASALDNLKTKEGLERQVAERTAAAEQRAAELALINRIQQGIAARLGFQEIVDLVGDRLREVFGSDSLSIRWWNREDDTMTLLYSVEHGQRLPRRPPSPVPHRNRLAMTVLGGRAATLGTRDEQLAAGLTGATPGTDWCLSIAGAPIVGTGGVLGAIVLENHEREHAYGGRRPAPADDHRCDPGHGTGERPPLRRDAAPAEGDRGAQRRVGGGSTASSKPWARRWTSRASSTRSATGCARCSAAATWASAGGTSRPRPCSACTASSMGNACLPAR